jgi:hypothetical protein
MWQNLVLKVWGKKDSMDDSLVSEAFTIGECVLKW